MTGIAQTIDRSLAAARPTWGRPAIWLGSIALFVLGYVDAVRQLAADDSVWFLQVAARVAHGDVLYRDVFFGAAPLSVYLTAPFLLIFGTQFAVVRALVALAYVANVLLVVSIARRLSIGRRPLLALAVIVWGAPAVTGLYQPLATVLLLVSMRAAVEWVCSRREVLLVAAAVAAGLSASSKQNVGGWGLVALLGVVAVGSHSRRLRLAAAVVGGFVAALAVMFLAVAAQGAAHPFYDFAIAKRSYLEHPAPYHRALGDFLHLLANPLADPSTLYWTVIVLFPIPVGLAVAAAWRLAPARERAEALVVLAYTFAFLAGLEPMADALHVQLAAPGILVGAAYSLDRLVPRLRRAHVRVARAALALWLAPGVVALFVLPLVWLGTGARKASNLPHFRGVLVTPAFEAASRSDARALATAAAGSPVFIVRDGASLYYLLAGIRDPTPYDYPSAVITTPLRQRALIAKIRAGAVEKVCIGPIASDSFRSGPLVRYVRSRLTRGADVGACTLYSRAGSPSRSPRR
jgi:4-amino-4-deoxy-L-arabinose transferase-like glycosyltransferase